MKRARTLRPAARSALIRAAACLAAMAGAAGCGSDAPPPIDLLTAAVWNEDPGTLDAIGYRVSVDFGWPSRAQSCFSLPSDLTVAVNDRVVTPEQTGECVWDILVNFDAVAPDGPVHVRIASGSRVYGEATYDDLFPGVGAQLVPAGDGTIHAGSQVVVALPATTVPFGPNLGAGRFYWLDAQPSGVPFYTFAIAPDGSVPQTVVMTAPAITGRAMLIVESVFNQGLGSATSCSGFESCTSSPTEGWAGPISVDIIP